MKKQRILIFTRYFLPGFRAGGPVRSVANLVQALKLDFDFRVVCLDSDHGSYKPYENIKTGQWQDVEGIEVFYASSCAFKKSFYKKIYEETKPDVIYFNSFFDRQFTLFPFFVLKNKNTPILIAPRGEFSDGALKQKALIKKIFLTVLPLRLWLKKVFWHATSEIEFEHIQLKMKPNQNHIFLAGNLPEIKSVNTLLWKSKKQNQLRLVLAARVSPMKNTLKAIQMVNQLTKSVEFDLWGLCEDQHYWHQCLEEIKRSPAHVKINYRGETTHSLLHDILQTYDAMLMPTLGENFGHSIIEALAAGLPVIISDQTPWINLKIKKIGADISLDDEDSFIKELKNLQNMNGDEFHELRKNCLNFISNWFESNENKKNHKKMIQTLTAFKS